MVELSFFDGISFNVFKFLDLINNFDGGIRQVYGEKRTAHIFATYPKSYLTLRGGLVDQVRYSSLKKKKSIF